MSTHAIVVALNVPGIFTVMRDMDCAIFMRHAQIRADIVLYYKNVLVVTQLATLTRFVREITITVQELRHVLTILVNRLLVDLIVCVLMGKAVIFALQGNGVLLLEHLCALIHRPLRHLRGPLPLLQRYHRLWFQLQILRYHHPKTLQPHQLRTPHHYPV